MMTDLEKVELAIRRISNGLWSRDNSWTYDGEND